MTGERFIRDSKGRVDNHTRQETGGSVTPAATRAAIKKQTSRRAHLCLAKEHTGYGCIICERADKRSERRTFWPKGT